MKQMQNLCAVPDRRKSSNQSSDPARTEKTDEKSPWSVKRQAVRHSAQGKEKRMGDNLRSLLFSRCREASVKYKKDNSDIRAINTFAVLYEIIRDSGELEAYVEWVYYDGLNKEEENEK